MCFIYIFIIFFIFYFILYFIFITYKLLYFYSTHRVEGHKDDTCQGQKPTSSKYSLIMNAVSATILAIVIWIWR